MLLEHTTLALATCATSSKAEGRGALHREEMA